jgi:subtilisin family serine protease
MRAAWGGVELLRCLRLLWPAPVVATCALLASPAPAGATAYRVATEEIVFQLPPASEADAAALIAELPGRLPQPQPADRWSTTLPLVEAAFAERILSRPGGADYVSPVGQVHATSAAVVPDNPCYSSQCGPLRPVVVDNPEVGANATTVHPNGQTDLWPSAINAPAAWAVTKGSPNIVVAVLDTGTDYYHQQLTDKVIVAPPVCKADLEDCSSAMDYNGHGTFVAGIIAADTNDGVGIAGLGWNTKVLDVKVLGDDGHGNTLDEANGIYAAVDDGARVINISSSNSPCGPTVAPIDCGPNTDQERAVEYAVAHDVVVVAATSDDGSNRPVYPADYPGVLAVAASTDQGVVDPVNGGLYLDFSDYGNDADISAPGIDVLSTWDDGNYAVGSGASYAAPHVAAAAALMLAVDPALSAPQVATLLQETASTPPPGGEPIDGGFLDVGAAVQAVAARQLPKTLDGYVLVSRSGAVSACGAVAGEGQLKVPAKASPVVAAAETARGLGYWLATADGGVFAFGHAGFHGSPARRHQHLAQPVVAMAATPDGRGYWLVTSSGQVLAFGDAHLYGSPAKLHLAKPVVAMAATPDGRGYWLVTSSGQVLAYGGAHLYGSPAKLHLAKPVVGMAATPDGHGYWLVGADGGVFNYGDAAWYGPAAAGRGRHIVGIAPTPDGQGYWLVDQAGHVYPRGSAAYEAAPAPRVPGPVVAISS